MFALDHRDNVWDKARHGPKSPGASKPVFYLSCQKINLAVTPWRSIGILNRFFKVPKPLKPAEVVNSVKSRWVVRGNRPLFTLVPARLTSSSEHGPLYPFNADFVISDLSCFACYPMLLS